MLTSGLYNGKARIRRKYATFLSIPSPVSVISFTMNGTQHIVTNSDPAMSE